jgi:murein DD-endopeptidase MepM/ murein hydrolase activator NlpD
MVVDVSRAPRAPLLALSILFFWGGALLASPAFADPGRGSASATAPSAIESADSRVAFVDDRDEDAVEPDWPEAGPARVDLEPGETSSAFFTLPDIGFEAEDAVEADDLDPEIPADVIEGDDISGLHPLPFNTLHPASLPSAEDDDQGTDWRAAAQRIRKVLLAPVEAIEKVVRRVGGRRKVVRVRRLEKPVPLHDDEVIALLRLRPIVPVDGVGRTRLSDSFFARRSGHRRHNAIDIGAPEGTPALAAIDGTVLRLSQTRAGGTGLYIVDDAGRFVFYYAHLQKLAPGIQAGSRVSKGDVVGLVGHTGNAKRSGPHLHLALSVLSDSADEGRAFRKRAILNPYPLLAFIP